MNEQKGIQGDLKMSYHRNDQSSIPCARISAIRCPIMDNKELHKVLLKMRNRVKKFGDLMRECFSRDREDNVSEGWLSKGEIATFEADMKNLVDDALKIERKFCNGQG